MASFEARIALAPDVLEECRMDHVAGHNTRAAMTTIAR